MKEQKPIWKKWFYQLLRFLLLINTVEGVAKFEVTSVSTSSIVVKMISAANVSRFEMDVTIFDLDRLREYRKTELSVGRHEDQVSPFLVSHGFPSCCRKRINYLAEL